MKLDDYIEYMIVTEEEDRSSNNQNATPAGQVGCLGSVIIVFAVIALLTALF